MAKKQETSDIVELWVAADMIKTQKAFCEAIDTALPDAGRWVYWDVRKEASMFRVRFHPEIVRVCGEVRRNNAKEWLGNIQPKLEAQGIRVLSAAVNRCDIITKAPVSGVYDSLLMTKEFWDRSKAIKVTA